ncbi:MAG TPA: NAD-dependent deacylase [Gaiellaceae bacterium]|nr:NAD-dependent deacylase [Gaiellaceae bacterium]
MGVERLAQLVRDDQPCVVLTGAGVSTGSGIPDFRSADGIWKHYDPLRYASIDAFLEDPERVWEFYAKRLETLLGAEPNDGHLALAELEGRGWIQGVITQNIDRLHERAGSRAVVEVHGSIATSSCLDCGAVLPLDEVVRLLPLPACKHCERPLKPDVVLFGELLPEHAIEQAKRLASEAGLLVLVGSSLEVYPVAGLPLETLDAGGMLAVVNRDPTPYDAEAAIVIRESIPETLRALAELLLDRR